MAKRAARPQEEEMTLGTGISLTAMPFACASFSKRRAWETE